MNGMIKDSIVLLKYIFFNKAHNSGKVILHHFG